MGDRMNRWVKWWRDAFDIESAPELTEEEREVLHLFAQKDLTKAGRLHGGALTSREMRAAMRLIRRGVLVPHFELTDNGRAMFERHERQKAPPALRVVR